MENYAHRAAKSTYFILSDNSDKRFHSRACLRLNWAVIFLRNITAVNVNCARNSAVKYNGRFEDSVAIPVESQSRIASIRRQLRLHADDNVLHDNLIDILEVGDSVAFDVSE